MGGRFGGGVVVRMDVNAMLGVGDDVGYERYKPRMEGIVQYSENKKKMGGRGRGNI